MTASEVADVVDRVKYPGFTFVVAGGERMTVRALFVAADRDPRALRCVTRRWVISEHATASEIVQTCLKCVLTALELEARERFTYRGEAVFGPHFDVEALVELAVAKRFEVREEAGHG